MAKLIFVAILFGVVKNTNANATTSTREINSWNIGEEEIIKCKTTPFACESFWSSNQMSSLPSSTTFIIIQDNTTFYQAQVIRDIVSLGWTKKYSFSIFLYENNFQNFHSFLRTMLNISSEIFMVSLLSFQQLVDLWRMVRIEHLENQKMKWLMTSSENVTSISSRIPIGHEVRIIRKTASSIYAFYLLRKFYSENNDGVQNQGLGSWSVKDVSSRTIDRRQENSLNGHVLKVAVVDNWPFFGLSFGGRTVDPTGIDVSLLKTLKEILQFNFQIVSPEDGQWGIPLTNGEITGMIGMVAKEEADLAIDEITITDQRDTVVDFTIPYYMESSVILSSAPKPASKVMAVFTPFTLRIWLLLAFSIFSYGFILWVTHEYLVRKKEKANLSIVFFVMTTLQSITFQGTHFKVQSWALRFLLIGWFFFGLLIYAIYAGSLTAVLAAPTFEKPLDSLKDLLQNKRVIPVVTIGSSIHQLLETATSGIYKQIYDRMDPVKSFATTVDEGVAKVLQGGFALIEAELATEIRATVLERKRFYVSRQTFYPQAYGVACRKGSYLVPLFNENLKKFIEQGLINKWKEEELRKISGTMKEKRGSRQEEIQPLTINHLQGAFILYLIGITTATVSFLVEIYFAKLIKKLNMRYRK